MYIVAQIFLLYLIYLFIFKYKCNKKAKFTNKIIVKTKEQKLLTDLYLVFTMNGCIKKKKKKMSFQCLRFLSGGYSF